MYWRKMGQLVRFVVYIYTGRASSNEQGNDILVLPGHTPL